MPISPYKPEELTTIEGEIRSIIDDLLKMEDEAVYMAYEVADGERMSFWKGRLDGLSTARKLLNRLDIS